MGNTVFSMISVLGFIGILFGLLSVTSVDIAKNPLLDNDSISNLATLNSQFDTIDISKTNFTNNATDNSTFEGTDAFQREFLESKATTEGSNKNIMEKTIGIPAFLLTALGLPQNDATQVVLGIAVTLLLVLIGLVVYKAWKTGQVD